MTETETEPDAGESPREEKVTLAGAFPAGKCTHQAQVDEFNGNGSTFESGRGSSDFFEFSCLDSSGSNVDIGDVPTEAYVEILVYLP